MLIIILHSLAFQAEGRGFEPRLPLHLKTVDFKGLAEKRKVFFFQFFSKKLRFSRFFVQFVLKKLLHLRIN